MAKALPYFKWYPADADTDSNFRGMDDADIGFYVRCLNHAWINGGVPSDPRERARVLRTRLDTANKRWERVGKCFVTSSSMPDQLINIRQESERELASKKSLKCAESVNARYGRTTNEPPRALARADSDSVSSFSSSSKEEVIQFAKKASGRFVEWWAMWSAIRGTNHQMQAEMVYAREVTIYNENDCMECTRSYLASLDNPAKGFHPENFLIDQAPGRFKARFKARSPPGGFRGACTVDELAESIEAFGRTRI